MEYNVDAGANKTDAPDRKKLAGLSKKAVQN